MKSLQRIVDAQPSQDGDGVKIHRLAGPPLHGLLNPYLMIDEINSDTAADYIGGFPEHPHRGFETITYMLAGRMRHRDHMGNEGVINPGDVQWMSAGRGVLHSEMPEQEQGLLHGFQIWLNLPAAEKMQPPAYRELTQDKIPALGLSGGGQVRAIAGALSIQDEQVSKRQPLLGALPPRTTQPLLLDVTLSAQESVELTPDGSDPVLVYVYHGASQQLRRRQLGVFDGQGALQLTAGAEGLSALVLSGQALDEPVVQYGPFVMNSREEIEQAFADLRNDEFVDHSNID